MKLDPAHFVEEIDNPRWPMSVGTTWGYRETGGGAEHHIEVTVTRRSKTILGVKVTVLHDQESVGGALIEDTFDWYAQDRLGNVWYMGEDTTEYSNGQAVSTTGSWEAGVDGAQPGIIMPGDPSPGLRYRQEYYKGQAEDRGEILSLNKRANVPYGSFEYLLETEDTTPLEPGTLEHKFYAMGVGPVLTLGGSTREELVEFHRG